jgi:hypothetical protein
VPPVLKQAIISGPVFPGWTLQFRIGGSRDMKYAASKFGIRIAETRNAKTFVTTQVCGFRWL